MSKEELIKKLTSRKFWVAVADFVSMILVAINMPENQVAQIIALIMAGAGVIAYIIGEGLVDSEGKTETETEIVTENATEAQIADEEHTAL